VIIPHRHIIAERATRFDALASGGVLDALIIGGGISGGCLFDELCQRGYRVGLVDQNDFASGTSQASGMLIWGGLLYLKNLDLATVFRLCNARKDLLEKSPDRLAPLDMHYHAGANGAARKAFVWSGMQLYWLLGGRELMRPRWHLHGGETTMLYQEAMLRSSDSRFVIERITAHQPPDHIALNHCRVTVIRRDRSAGVWHVEMRDGIHGHEHTVRTKVLVNAAGVWADEVNRIAALDSPVRHVWSKGVYLALPRGPDAAHVYPMHGRDDVLTHVPWGPVSMWGPTETHTHDLNTGLVPNRDDVAFLLNHARTTLRGNHGGEDVVSIRCGIRPLAVSRDFNRDVYPLSLSRKHRIVCHRGQMALSLYGGKFTTGIRHANEAADALASWIKPARAPSRPPQSSPATATHPALGHEFVTPEWARDHECCATLDDYLRRRTNIAQWLPRMGLGRHNEHRDSLLPIAAAFADDPAGAGHILQVYEDRVCREYDPLLNL